ncbi:MAG: hypothetical protein IJW18_03185 [Lachnospiraceae bacterium]|nr:hypothetical protein [Lachnospiraceae bacterium]
MNSGSKFSFNYEWIFKKANAFPLDKALESNKDVNGKYFYEEDYVLEDWKEVSLPHTFNDEDAFVSRIADHGSEYDRTFSFYRKNFVLDAKDAKKKVIIEFEGVRQTAYVYINGKMAGFSENGVAPFALDITGYVRFGEANLIAIATDNTSSRNVNECAGETPNKEDVEPGYYSVKLTGNTVIPPERQGTGYLWNCNDFNPSFGGLSKNVWLHIKNPVYLTLPVYSNLRTKGVYVYATDFDIANHTAKINVEAEIKNESDEEAKNVNLLVKVFNHEGKEIAAFESVKKNIVNVKEELPPLTITPEDAYEWDAENGKYVAIEEEDKVAPTETASKNVTVIEAASQVSDLRFWCDYDPYLYDVYVSLVVDGEESDSVNIQTGFRKVSYDKDSGLYINDKYVWLTGYAQRSTNEWAAVGVAPDWLKDYDAKLIRESNANFIRWMHVAACPADIRSYDRYGVVCVQPAGDKERHVYGRQWDQRVELMRDVIIYYRNNPSIIFWETGNNAVSKEHMREMTLLKRELDPNGGRYMGCRTICTMDVICESEFVGTMLNRFAGRFESELMPIVETEYLRDESPRRVWDDFSPPDYDYKNRWLGRHGKKQMGGDMWDQTAEDFVIAAARSYHEFFNDRVGGASGKNFYSATAALCWTDSAQHGRQSASENARMSGRVDAVRVPKQSFYAFKTLQNTEPDIMIVGHWNYPKEGGDAYKYEKKAFDGQAWEPTGEYDYRDPKHKTVYVIGNPFIAKVELYVNGKLIGACSEPEKSFVYPFRDVDVTASGRIEAIAYDMQDKELVRKHIDTVNEPAKIVLRPVTGSKGLMADGADVAFFDVEVVDNEGRICPLCYDRIDFEISGEAKFLGGYNSGKFNGYGKNDSVIHQMHVYAECGNNRVFVRSTKNAGEIVLTAKMGELKTTVSINSVEVEDMTPVSTTMPQLYGKEDISDVAKESPYDALVGTKEILCRNTFDTRNYYKVTVNGREVDFKGSDKVYEQTGIYGPVLPVLDHLLSVNPNLFTYTYDEKAGRLTLTSGDETIEATVGQPPLIVNGEENLMNGEPELHNGEFCMEINTAVSYIKGVKADVDNNIFIYKLELEVPEK